jgi:pilus assembly protein Flp/PilA
MLQLMKALMRDDEGQDLAEYALLIALIALVVIGAVTALGNQVSDVFDSITSKLATP